MDKAREIFRRHEAAYDYDVLRFGSVCYVIHPTLFVKKSVYDQLGAYRYENFLNCCDVDFILRLGQSGLSNRPLAAGSGQLPFARAWPIRGSTGR